MKMRDAQKFSKCFVIEILGSLNESSVEYFCASGIIEVNDGDRTITQIKGCFDQAGLRGVLTILWDFNLTILSVRCIEYGGDD